MRYVQLPKAAVDTQLLEDATRKGESSFVDSESKTERHASCRSCESNQAVTHVTCHPVYNPFSATAWPVIVHLTSPCDINSGNVYRYDDNALDMTEGESFAEWQSYTQPVLSTVSQP